MYNMGKHSSDGYGRISPVYAGTPVRVPIDRRTWVSVGRSHGNDKEEIEATKPQLSGWKTWNSQLAKKHVKKRRPFSTRAERKRWCKLLELEQKRKQARTMRVREAIEEEMKQLPR